MGRLIAGFFIAALICAGSTWAQDLSSANATMPGCRNYVQNDGRPRSAQDAFDQGICLGIVKAIVVTDANMCPPASAVLAQAMRVVTQYIDSRPARLHEDFIVLTIEALRTAWPCKR